MELSTVNDLIQSQPRKIELEKAVALEDEIRYYTERFQLSDNKPFDSKFKTWVSDRLNNEHSYNNFITSITYPLPTAQFVEDIYSKLGRIWDAQNPYFNITTANDSISDTAEIINLDWWKTKGWDLLKTKPNCILLVNLPQEQITERPEPYIEAIDIRDVIDVKVVGNKIEHLIYRYSKTEVAAIDKDKLQVYSYNEDEKRVEVLLFETVNELKECPAYFLSNIKYNSECDIVRCNPLTNSLGKLKNLLLLTILKNISDPYSFYLFIIKYGTQGCTYSDGINRCVGGYLQRSVKNDQNGSFQSAYVLNDSGTGVRKCPKCNKSLGIGNEITRPMPTDSQDKDLSNIIQFAAPPKDILEYSETYLKNYQEKIFAQIVGNDQELNPKMNHNETAYRYNIEGMQTVLLRWKYMFDDIIKEVSSTKIFYVTGKQPTGITVDLGTDFLLLDIQDLYSEKDSAIKAGISTALNFNDRIIETKFKNNPDLRNRAFLINYFKPFDEAIEKTEESYKAKTISKKDYYKAKYLENFINWYEQKYVKLNVLLKEKETFDKALMDMDEKFNEFFTLKTGEIESSSKMLAEVIGVGGTTSMITILTDQILTAEQKESMLKTLFNIDESTAKQMTQTDSINPNI